MPYVSDPPLLPLTLSKLSDNFWRIPSGTSLVRYETIIRQLRTEDPAPEVRKEDISPVKIDDSAVEDHCRSSMNKTRGLSSKATQDKKFCRIRRVLSSASAGETSIFSFGQSPSGKSFSRSGTMSIKIGKSVPSADETVFLK